MTQAVNRVAVAIRMHDVLMGLAGRVDDDALTDARELLAATELDRSLELLVGTLLAGRIPVTAGERDELVAIADDTRLPLVGLDRLAVSETRVAEVAARHRFAGGTDAAAGVADAVLPILPALPDVRSVRVVWRATPAGSVPSAVPARIVIVEVGPGGYPPATAYRVAHALHRVGVHAAVEVLRDGVARTAYHETALRLATAIPMDRPVPTAERPADTAVDTSFEVADEGRDVPPFQPVVVPTLPPLSLPRVDPDPPTEPTLVGLRPVGGDLPGSPEDELSEQELTLLRQLQDELARREQSADEPGWFAGGAYPGRVPGSSMVNGVPPGSRQGSGEHDPA